MAKGTLFAPELETCLQHFQQQIVTELLKGERQAGSKRRESIAAE
jgi:hypothetical protein